MSFDAFYDAINLPGDHHRAANDRRDWLERVLKGKLEVLQTLSFGSIPRFTALQAHADVDLLAVLHYGRHIEGKAPSAVLQLVRDALAPHATTSIRRNGQAVTLRFESWPNVDVVPASGVSNSDTGDSIHYEIPDMHREEWLVTNPLQHSRVLQDKAKACGPNLRRLITMVKHWNRVKNSSRLQSYHIEAIALDTYATDMSDLPWELQRFFEAAVGRLNFHWYGGADVSAYLDYDTRGQVRTTLTEAKNLATSAWATGYRNPDDHREAIGLWRNLFGMAFPSYG